MKDKIVTLKLTKHGLLFVAMAEGLDAKTEPEKVFADQDINRLLRDLSRSLKRELLAIKD